MILFGFGLALVIIYAMVLLVAGIGWLKKEAKTIRTTEKNWTVIVPFRNEENNLPRLLQSLDAQKNPLSLILVNDHSTDASLQVIEKERAKLSLSDLTVLTNEGEGKKAASATGLKAAKTSLVFFTDADCALPPEFLDKANGHITNADFFYGPVVYGFDGQRTNAVFFLDQLALNAVSLGLGKMGLHTYCSGANMGGDTAKLLPAVDALKRSNNLSGDDVTYLQQAVKQKQHILPLTDRGLTVRTAAPSGIGEFLQQRLRWGQKASGYKGIALPALSALVWMVNTLVLVVLIGCLSGGLSPRWYAIPLAKLCIDLLFLFLVALRMKSTPYLWAFLPAWLLNLMYVPAIAVLGAMTNTTWKGRKLKPRSGATAP